MIENMLRLLSILLLLPFFGTAQYSQASFKHLGIEDGLSQSVVKSIVQDKYGFMWFGTNDGLNKYDGYTFKVFRKKEGLGDVVIQSLLIVNDTLLFIGTRNAGIDILNLKTYKIVGAITAQNGNLSSNCIFNLQLDNKKQIWAGTENGINIITPEFKVKNKIATELSIGSIKTLNEKEAWFTSRIHGVFHYKNGSLTKYTVPRSSNFNINYYSLVIDSNKRVWVGTSDGIYYKNALGNSFTEYIIPELQNNSLKVLQISLDNNKNIWINLLNHGLYHINTNTLKHTIYNESNDKLSLSLKTTNTLYQDKNGVIWIGTNGYGVEYFLPVTNFKTISKDNSAAFKLSGKSIRGVSGYYGNSNMIWVGSYGGIDLVDLNKGTIKSYSKSNYEQQGLLDYSIYEINHIGPNTLLVGTETEGLLLLNLSTQKFSQLNNVNSFQSVFKLFPDKDGVWTGTNKGLYLLDLSTNKVAFKVSMNDDPDRFNIHDIDKIGDDLLLSTSKGLFIYNKQENKLKLLKTKNNQQWEPQVYSVFNKDNQWWICTRGDGLIKAEINRSGKSYELSVKKIYTSENLLSNDVIYAVLADKVGTLWFSSNNGLSSFDEKTEALHTYFIDDGLQGNEFNANSYYASPNGNMFFGGIYGLSYFNPQLFIQRNTNPIISFTSFKIFNQSVDTTLNINELSSIQIPYSENVLTFSFSTADYLSKKRTKYAYKLHGFSDDFIQLGNNNTVTFTNLNPGEYLFQVIATNGDGVWDQKGRSIKLVIVPPFWLTTWFYIYLAVLIIIIVYLIIVYRTRKIKQINERLEKEVGKRTQELSEKNKLLADAKDYAVKSANAKVEFLATMSHEIRTPMNGVVGMISLLENSNLSEEQRTYIDVIRNSTDNLIQIVNDILDFSKIDSGKLELHFEKVHLHRLVDNCMELFSGKAFEKNIELISFIDNRIPEYIVTDQTRLKQILFNLIGNAVKFTPSGHILLMVKPDSENNLVFSVTDTGIGIAPEKQERIFELFTQADNSTSRKYGGTGLGLTISKNLVELMGGKIKVNSNENEGATFIFNIKVENLNQKDENNQNKSNYKHILIDFTNPLTSKSCAHYIEAYGIKTSIVSKGTNLPQLLRDQDIDLIITDNLTTLVGVKNLKTENIHIALFANKKINDVALDYFYPKPFTRHKLANILISKSVNQAQSAKKESDNLFAKQFPLRILVAEDNSMNQNIFKRIFQNMGYEITVVENGKLATWEVDKKKFDVVFMDIHMPEMDGIEATKTIIENKGQQAPVIIALTASVISHEIDAYMQAGMKDVLSKPLNVDDLKAVLMKWSRQVQGLA